MERKESESRGRGVESLRWFEVDSLRVPSFDPIIIPNGVNKEYRVCTDRKPRTKRVVKYIKQVRNLLSPPSYID